MQRRDENQRLQEQGEQVSVQTHDLERTYEQGQPQQQQPSFQRWVCQKDEESTKEERQETRRANRPSSCLPASLLLVVPTPPRTETMKGADEQMRWNILWRLLQNRAGRTGLAPALRYGIALLTLAAVYLGTGRLG